MKTNLDKMVDAYLVCALWASVDPETEAPLDDAFDQDDIATESVASARATCIDFLQLCDREGLDYSALDPGQMGHDLWLTRNHHGAGFWDRGLGKLGDDLTKWAESMGSSDAYPGDDGRVYLS